MNATDVYVTVMMVVLTIGAGLLSLLHEVSKELRSNKAKQKLKH